MPPPAQAPGAGAAWHFTSALPVLWTSAPTTHDRFPQSAQCAFASHYGSARTASCTAMRSAKRFAASLAGGTAAFHAFFSGRPVTTLFLAFNSGLQRLRQRASASARSRAASPRVDDAACAAIAGERGLSAVERLWGTKAARHGSAKTQVGGSSRACVRRSA